jgi:glycosyltransferase involved in cell wall biosynthesis
MSVTGAASTASPAATPLVSVLMTAYNREDYIAEAIESVLAQTFTDFELIVVDDRSTDRTREAVQHYLRDPRVRLICNERNLGDYPNRNHASTFARGEFMKYHDSDDLMYPHCLEIMVSALRAHPSAAFALSGDAGWPGGPSPMLLTPRMCYQREFLGSGAVFRPGPAGALFRTAAFVELGRFPLGGTHSDTLFWITACASRSVVLAQGDLLYYRVHAGQELQQSGRSHELARVEGLMFRALDAPGCPLDAAEREQAKRNLAGGFISRMISDVRNAQPRRALLRLKHSGLSLVEWLRYARLPKRQTAAGTPPALVKEQE